MSSKSEGVKEGVKMGFAFITALMKAETERLKRLREERDGSTVPVTKQVETNGKQKPT